MTKPNNHQSVIDLWPSKAEFGRAIGVGEDNARKMYTLGIPAKHYGAVVKALAECGFPAVTYAELAEMAKADPV